MAVSSSAMRITSALLGILLLARSSAALCDRPQPRLICAEYFQSKAVVTAHLIRIHAYPNRDEPDYFVYEMKLVRALRGDVLESFRIYEGNDSGRSTFEWKLGGRYLLFLFPTIVSGPHTHNTWSVDGCGNSGPLPRSAALPKGIETLLSSQETRGAISGVVGEGLSDAVSGATVTATGNGRIFKNITNADGQFKIRVPAGEYRVTASKRKIIFRRNIFSYEDPRHVIVDGGGCAQIQFTRTED